jgi:hypothetical protein
MATEMKKNLHKKLCPEGVQYLHFENDVSVQSCSGLLFFFRILRDPLLFVA